MQFDDFLLLVKKEALRLHQEEGLPLSYSWEQAHHLVMRREAERPNLSELQDSLLKALEVLSPTPRHAPVWKAQLMGKVPGLESDWQAWYQLDQLRKAGKVRLLGKRWKATSTMTLSMDGDKRVVTQHS